MWVTRGGRLGRQLIQLEYDSLRAGKVMKGSLTRKAMDYTLNQWPTLVGDCERRDLQISSVLAENAEANGWDPPPISIVF